MLNKKKGFISILIILLFISLAWNPIIEIIGELEPSKTNDETKGRQIDRGSLSEFKFESSPAILQYTVPDPTGKVYKTVTRVISGNNSRDSLGNKSYIFCFEYDSDFPQENKLVWKYLISENHSIYSSPTIANIDPTSGTPEIIFGADDGYIYCLNVDGKLLWRLGLGELTQLPIRSSPAIANIYDDPDTETDNDYLEIIVGSDDNKIYSIYYDQDYSLWMVNYKFQTMGMIRSSPTIADINNDGDPDIIIGSDDGKIYCLDDQLRKDWDFNTGSRVRATAAIADIDRDGNLEIIVGSENGDLYCIDNNGIQISSTNLGAPLRASPAIANIDDTDEALEFVLAYDTGTTSSSTKVACFKLEKDGSSQWIINTKWTFSKNYAMKLDLRSNVITIDKNDHPDGVFEVIASDGYNIFVLDSQGNKEAEYTGHQYGGSPVVADIDTDGLLEISVGKTIFDTHASQTSLLIEQTYYKCPPRLIKWGMFGAGEKHNGNGDNRFAILIEGSKGDNDFEQEQMRSDIEEMARVLTTHPGNTGPGYTGHYLRDHIFYVGLHDDISEINMYKKIPENNDLINPGNNYPDGATGKNYIFDAISKVANMCDSYDSVIFYYTSHGKYSGSDFDTRTYLFDANDCHNPYSKIGDISPDELNDALNTISCSKMYVILQPCYSGNWIEYLVNKPNRVILASDTSTNPGERTKVAIFDKGNIMISDSNIHDLYYVGTLDQEGVTVNSIDDSDPKIDGEEYDNDDTDPQEYGRTYHQWYSWVRKSGSDQDLYEIDKDRSDNLDPSGNPVFNKMFYENFKDQGAEFVSGITEAYYKDYLNGTTVNRNNVLDADEYTKNRYLQTNGDSNGYISCTEAYDFMKIWHFGVQIKKVWEDDPIIIYTKLPEGENYLLF